MKYHYYHVVSELSGKRKEPKRACALDSYGHVDVAYNHDDITALLDYEITLRDNITGYLFFSEMIRNITHVAARCLTQRS